MLIYRGSCRLLGIIRMNINQEVRLTIKDMQQNPLQWLIMIGCSTLFGAAAGCIVAGLGKPLPIVIAVGIVAGVGFLYAMAGPSQ